MSTLATTNLKHASSGSNNIVLASDGTTTIAAPSNIIKSGTAVASTSGTSIDFTGIPSWVKRVTMMFNEVSTSGSDRVMIQIGSGSVSSSNYLSTVCEFVSTSINNHVGSTAGFLVGGANASDQRSGIYTLSLLGSNTWCGQGTFRISTNVTLLGSGVSGDIGGALDRVRITTTGGTQTFDAGTINILYEG